MPVAKKVGDEAYSGSIVKQGEMQAVVIATGANTFFGRTAKLVAGAGAISHAQKAMFQIGNFLIVVAQLRPEQVGSVLLTYTALPLCVVVPVAIFLLCRVDARFVAILGLTSFAVAGWGPEALLAATRSDAEGRLRQWYGSEAQR